MVLPPISNNPEVPKLMRVPEMVMPGPPAVRVVAAIEKAVGSGIKVWPATVRAVGDRFTVLLPMSSIPEAPKLMRVPAMVIPGLPGERVVPATLKPEGFAVKVCPAADSTVVMGNCWVVAAALGAAAAAAAPGVAKA